MAAVKDIFNSNGVSGLYTGFRLHFGESSWPVEPANANLQPVVRDTSGTALFVIMKIVILVALNYLL